MLILKTCSTLLMGMVVDITMQISRIPSAICLASEFLAIHKRLQQDSWIKCTHHILKYREWYRKQAHTALVR